MVSLIEELVPLNRDLQHIVGKRNPLSEISANIISQPSFELRNVQEKTLSSATSCTPMYSIFIVEKVIDVMTVNYDKKIFIFYILNMLLNLKLCGKQLLKQADEDELHLFVPALKKAISFLATNYSKNKVLLKFIMVIYSFINVIFLKLNFWRRNVKRN